MVANSRMNEQELLAAFDEAIENDHIFAYFQPQVNHSTGRMVGAEALMRWKDPECGMQYPSDFIPVLESNGLIYKADLHLFDMVDPQISVSSFYHLICISHLQRRPSSGCTRR